MVPIYSYPPTIWVRSKDRIVAGVCAGIATRLGLEPWIVRFFWVIAVLFFGTGLLAYLLLAIALPREDRVPQAYEKMLLGVCVRLAYRTDIEIGLIRAATLILGCVTFGLVVVGYIALYFLLPESRHTYDRPNSLS